MKKLFINVCSILFTILCIGEVHVYGQENQDSIANVAFDSHEKDLVNVAFGTQNKEDVLGAVSSVNIADLLKKNYQTYSLDGISSFVGGYNGNIWGQGFLILIDGIPRDAGYISPTEIETVTVLKGANAVVLYGSKAAKGAVLITTKRGKEHPMTIEARVNTGMYVPKSYPKYLDAASYMTYYNEACENDGKSHLYSDATIYNTAAGVNPYMYPDIDFFSSDYLRKAYNKTDATVEISGGDEKTQYYTNFGMNYNNDLVNYGEQSKNEDLNFNLRGNVDMKLTKWLSAKTNAHVIYNNNYTGRGDFWGSSATMRPNWFTPLIPISMVDPNNTNLQTTIANSNHIIDGKYLLGGNSNVETNAFADMLAAGYIRYKERVFQFDVSAKSDLSGITKGLSLTNSFSLDYVNYYSEAYKLSYATYEPTWSNMNGDDMIVDLTTHGFEENSTDEYVGDSKYKQTMTFYSQLNYERTFNNIHNVTGNVIAWGFQYHNSVDSNHDGSDYHSISNANLGIQLAYNYEHKYYADFSGAVIHSAKLAEGNREAFSPTVTLGWRLSDENFMKDLSIIDNLKLTASYAKLNQDIDLEDDDDEYYLYQGYYDDSNWFTWRDGTMGGSNSVLSKRGSNPDLNFVTRKEFRVGLEGALLKNRVMFDINYFNQVTDGLLTQGSSTIYPSYFDGWNYSFLPYVNYNKDKRTGLDFSVSYNDKMGDLEYQIGFVGMIYDSEAIKRDEVYDDAYLYREGKPLDASFGYLCEGFFTDQADIDNHATQTFGDVQPGDLKYTDVNGDGTIDYRDQVELGKYGSPFTYGVNLTLKYKNWTLFAMGQGQSGAIGYKNSQYYWVYGSRKYSEEMLGRWTTETASTATYPRLTTTSNTNNFRNSTFWQYKNNRFDLSKIQVTYDLPEKMFNKNSLLSQLSVYVSGQNLLTISKERKMMEMNIGSAPQCRFYNLGIKAHF